MNFEKIKKSFMEKYPESKLSDDKLADYFIILIVERPQFADTKLIPISYFIKPSSVDRYLLKELMGKNNIFFHPHASYTFSNFVKTKKIYQQYYPNSQLENYILIAFF